jgi:exodeoxyribonuclease V gamma subunit
LLTVIRGNRLETLADELVRRLGSDPRPSALAPEVVAVQSQGMRAWLARRVAERLGVFAGIRTPFPRDLIEDIIASAGGGRPGASPVFQPAVMAFAIADILPGRLGAPEFEPLAGYLADDDRGVKLHQLSRVLAKTFDEYLVYRPEMILEWQRRPPADSWQAALWNALRRRAGPADVHVAEAARELLEGTTRPAPVASTLPDRLSLFGVTTLPPLYVRVLAALPEACDVRWYLPAPTPEYFVDLDGRAGDRPAIGEPGHPLLASLGRLARDTQAVLLETGGDRVLEVDLFAEPDGAGALGALQRDLHRALREPPPPADGTIEIHSCHGPAREAEVLKDRLLALFDDLGLALLPEDVLVMTPDVDGYAPYIEAAFSRGGQAGPSIPLAVSDRNPRSEQPELDAFAALLGLVRGRVRLSEVLDLLARDPVRERFGLDADGAEAIHGLLAGAGVRWGRDGAHRAALGLPTAEENTWRFGLDRLLLGRAMPVAERLLFAGVAPADPGAGGTDLLGALVRFTEALFGALDSLDGRHAPDEWRRRLGRACESLIAPGRRDDDEGASVPELLADLVRDAGAAGFGGTLDFEVVRDLLLSALESLPGERRFLARGVQLCDLKPMRSIPARVVILAGLGDGAFPRSRTAPAFDLIRQEPRPGDRSIRDDDRYLFLEALLSARDRLIVTYPGRDSCTGDRKNPSVLVTELLEHIDRGALLEHPRHPFDPRYFDPRTDIQAGVSGPPGLFSYAAGQIEAARAMAGQRRCLPRFLPGPLPHREPEGGGPRVIRLADLERFFRWPAGHFLEHRLELRPEPGPAGTDDREPARVDHLGLYRLGGEVLGWLLDGRPEDGLADYLQALGELPPGTAGRLEVERIRAEVDPVLRECLPVLTRPRVEPIEFRLDLDSGGTPLRLDGRLDGLREDARASCRFVRLGPAAVLEQWLRHLALCAVAPPGHPRRSVAVGRAGKSGAAGAARLDLESLAPDGARERLAGLAALYLAGESEPLRFHPEASWAHEQALREDGDPDRALQAARRRWPEEEGAKAGAPRLFPDGDPVGAAAEPGMSFPELSRRVLGPLFDHLAGGAR